MTDAGGIVGTISLTLQVLQGLNWYYSQFKSYHDDIKAFVNHVERIQNNVQLLRQVILDLKRGDALVVGILSNIAECRETVEQLKLRLKSIEEPEYHPDRLNMRLVLVKRRILYPFRKDTLASTRQEIVILEASLQTVLQALNIETLTKSQNHARTEAHAIQHSISLIARRQIHQTELLQSIEQSTEEQLSYCSQIESRTQQLIHGQTVYLKRQLDSLRTDLGQFLQQSGPVVPAGVGPETYDECFPTVIHLPAESDSLSSDSHPVRVFTNGYQAMSAQCTCPYISRGHHGSDPQRWISTFWFKKLRHLPNCPLANQLIGSATLGIIIPTRFGDNGRLIEIVVGYSSFSFFSRVSLRNIVPWRSPGFQLIDALNNFIYRQGEYGDYTNVPEAMAMLLRSLHLLLSERRIGPLDVTPVGETLAHRMFVTLAGVIRSFPDRLRTLSKYLFALTQFLTQNGFELNARDKNGKTSLDGFLITFCTRTWFGSTSVPNIPIADLGIPLLRDLDYGLENAEPWEMSHCRPSLEKLHMELLSANNNFDGCELSQLTRSVLLRSKSDLSSAISHLSTGGGEPGTELALHKAANWPSGLQTLLSKKVSFARLDNHGRSALDWAIRYRNKDAIQLLAEDLGLVSSHTWSEALFIEDLDIIRRVATVLGIRYQIDCCGQKRRTELDYERLFHHGSYQHNMMLAQDLTPSAAQILYDAGFHSVDTNLSDLGTPLWHHAHHLCWEKDLKLIVWFISKGAALISIHPSFRTMPLHLIAEKIVLNLAWGTWDNFGFACVDSSRSTTEISSRGSSIPDSELELSCLIFGNMQADECTCGCSIGGCNVVSSAIRAAKNCLDWPFIIAKESSAERLQKCALQTLLLLIPDAVPKQWVFASGIRVMTFDALKLTHTCHDHGHMFESPENVPSVPMLREEVEMVECAEGSDYEFLDDLMKHFEDIWERYNGTMVDFVDEHWIPRMKAVLAERNAPRRDETKELKNAGLLNVRHGPEIEQEQDNEPLYGTWTWFEWRLGKILDGTYLEGKRGVAVD